ncbi:MAG: DUF5110 domain-containing protein [Verrucomicrobia bacterium]|nr:DUF5110 domain-containing protein [Verrucomicrobiota bacterium]MCH8525546.1 glycoside hydrolase family 31 protein [Kiritimatiellia bacterium]
MNTLSLSPAPTDQKTVRLKHAARFTVITPSCVRMEYCEHGNFIDEPTLFAANRHARCPDAAFIDQGDTLVIRTDRMTLTYREDGKPFHKDNLHIRFERGGESGEWVPGMASTANLGGAMATLDKVSKAVPLPEGLLARDGWHLIDDSAKPILVDQWIEQRPQKGRTGLDWYFFGYGLDYKSALVDLTTLSGKVPLPRKHVFGSWYCRWYPYSADDFRQLADGYREHDFPLDIMVMDMDWHTTRDARLGYGHARNLGWTGYTWNRELIPEPEKLLREFKEDGIFTVLNDHPCDGMRAHEENYPLFLKHLQTSRERNRTCIPFDAGDRDYMKAFFTSAHAPVEKQGVDFWWLDWQQDYIYPYVRGVPYLPHLPWLNHLYYHHSQKDGRRGQGFSRWGGWGDHRHPIHFSGDAAANWEMLPFEIRFTLASGNSGCFFWAHDIGGFHGERDPELYVRWVQFGALSAALRLHSTGTHLDRRPWLWGDTEEKAMRDAFRLRAQLMPYLYTAVRQCHDHSLPLLRPMYLDHPENERAYEYDLQYMLGNDLLVAPVVTPLNHDTGTVKLKIWFPAGKWFNFFTGECIEGDCEREMEVGIDDIPLFARAGTPIPMQPCSPRMTTTPLETLIIRCYPGASDTSSLYQDDGQTEGYLNGEYTQMELAYEERENEVIIKIGPQKGGFPGQTPIKRCRIELPCSPKAQEVLFPGCQSAFEYEKETATNIIEFNPASLQSAVDVKILFETSTN